MFHTDKITLVVCMLFNSAEFLIFFPVVILIYYICPKKIKYIWLLAASYFFYMCWDIKYSLLLLFSTIITYFSGLALAKAQNKRLVVAFSFVINLALLGFFKYTNFLLDTIQRIFSRFSISLAVPHFSILLPVGISFYIFQALSYTMDVYREEIEPEKNFLKYALFVSYFPQLVAGPIERSKNLLPQIVNLGGGYSGL